VVSNDDVMKVVQEAVRQFGGSVQKFQAKTLPSIVLSDTPPAIKIVIQEASPKSSHETARKLAGKATVCVETWDGYITIDGERSDAILVNYWMQGRGPIFFVQRYKLNPFEWVGEAIAGEEVSVLQR
jgi:hypothetical protein